VHADPEPRDAVAPPDADQAEEDDHPHFQPAEVVPLGVEHEELEVDDHDRADERLENDDEAALGLEVRAARRVDQLRDLAHRAVHREALELQVLHETEAETETTDDDAEHEE